MDTKNSSVEAQVNEPVEMEETTAEDTNIEEWLPQWETDTENKWQSKAIKLLAQRNEARRQVEELEQRLSQIEWKLSAEDQAKQESVRNSFKARYWEDALKQAEDVLNQHPSLSIEQAYQLAGWTLQKNPNRFTSPWRTPSDLREWKQLSDLWIDELRWEADKELRAMMWL